MNTVKLEWSMESALRDLTDRWVSELHLSNYRWNTLDALVRRGLATKRMGAGGRREYRRTKEGLSWLIESATMREP